MMNDKFSTHTASGNGTARQSVDRHREKPPNLKFGIFYLAVGVLLFLANQFAKQPEADRNQPNPLSNVSLVLSVGGKPGPIGIRNDPTVGAAYAIHFRLANRGNQSVFYPVNADTNHPKGQLVYRVAPGSEWEELSWPKQSASASAPPSVGGKISWIEMPPGGWVDGTYQDPGTPGRDHAYEIDLKVAGGDNVVRFVSQAYGVNGH